MTEAPYLWTPNTRPHQVPFDARARMVGTVWPVYEPAMTPVRDRGGPDHGYAPEEGTRDASLRALIDFDCRRSDMRGAWLP
jgi:hypothetical protein